MNSHEFFSKVSSEKSAGSKKTNTQTQDTMTKYEHETLRMGRNRVMVVSHVATNDKMETLVNQLIGTSIFKYNKVKWSHDLQDIPIQSHHDVEKNIIHNFFALPTTFSDLLSKNITSTLRQIEKLKLKVLTFLFSISHVIIIQLENGFSYKIFDLLKNLNNIKQEFAPEFQKKLEKSLFTCNLTNTSIFSPGRVIPVLAFLSMDTLEKKSKTEQTIRTILKKSNLFFDENFPLFSLDPSKCHISLKHSEANLVEFGLFKVMQHDIKIQSDRLTEYLSKQFEYFSKNTGIKKNHLPSSYNWFHSAYALEELYKTTKVFDGLDVLLNPMETFSESRSKIGYNIAKEHFHESLNIILDHFNLYAIGTYKEDYKEKILQDYTNYLESHVKLYKFCGKGPKCPIADLKIEILGDAKSYNPLKGIMEDGFIADRNFLYSTDFALDNTPMNLNSIGEKQTKTFPLFFGYDFVCNSKRYILPPPLNQETNHWVTEQEFLGVEIGMIMNPPTVFNIKDDEKAWLQQMYIVTPNSQQLFLFRPKISFEQRGEDTISTYELDENIWLPKNSLIRIKFDYLTTIEPRRVRIKLMGNSVTLN